MILVVSRPHSCTRFDLTAKVADRTCLGGLRRVGSNTRKRGEPVKMQLVCVGDRHCSECVLEEGNEKRFQRVPENSAGPPGPTLPIKSRIEGVRSQLWKLAFLADPWEGKASRDGSSYGDC